MPASVGNININRWPGARSSPVPGRRLGVKHYVVSRYSALQKLDELRLRGVGGAGALRVHHMGAIWEGGHGLDHIRRLVQRHVAEEFIVEEAGGQYRTRFSVNYRIRLPRY